MKFRKNSPIISLLILFIVLSVASSVAGMQFARTVEAETIIVPDDYPIINWAVGNASTGDTIFVKKGTCFNVTLVINKSLSLIGEDSRTTVLKGLDLVWPYASMVLAIFANDVKISGFTIAHDDNGIWAGGNRTQIIGNNIVGNDPNKKSSSGCSISLGSFYNTIARNNISYGYPGIYCYGSYNTIAGNNIVRGSYGIELDGSFNTISGNNIIGPNDGVKVNANSSTITKNNIVNSTYGGLYLETGSRNIIAGNNITENKWRGIMFDKASSNILYGNHIANNGYGGLALGCGVCFISFHGTAENNNFYHNNFMNNIEQVILTAYINDWDNGSEGNYWSDYVARYPYAKEIDGSGIWNTPYFIDMYDKSNVDHYPLLKPVDISAIVIPTILEAVPPTIFILSPKNKTYSATDVSLTFTVSEHTHRMSYSLDGQANITITENTTLTGLSDGTHSLTVYARDTTGNVGSSDRLWFTINAPPSISILSPENKTYTTTGIPLTFTLNEPASWIRYSLDGQNNVTITGNTTLTGLSYDSHSITVYANDKARNIGASAPIYFTIAQKEPPPQPSEPFPLTWIAAVIAVITIGVAVIFGVAVYRRKRLTSNKTPN